MSKLQRRRILVDRPLQTAVILRTTLYWALGTFAQVAMVLYFALITASRQDFVEWSPQLWWQLQISLMASAVLLPIILLDVVRLSHRWVGPIVRLRNSLKSLGRGEPITEIRFRDGDFWQDLAGDLNAVSTEITRLKANSNNEPSLADDAQLTTTHREDSRINPPAVAIAP